MQVALNASASEDPEGFNLKEYKWSVNGEEIEEIDGVVGVWTATVPGTYTFTIEVRDQGDLPATGTCTETVVG
jgi:hypothetical protein